MSWIGKSMETDVWVQEAEIKENEKQLFDEGAICFGGAEVFWN